MLKSEPDTFPDFFVAIGASGSQGLDDIACLLEHLPPNLQAVLLIVLHRPSDRISHLREVLDLKSSIPICVAAAGELLRNGYGYIGEPDAHLTLAASSFGELVPGAHNLYRNRSVDLLFQSVATHAAGGFIGVVLSGSLDDGSRGLAAIHAAGGITMVLTPHGSLQKGMPENAIGYDGPIDFIGAPEAIAAKVAEYVRARRPR